MSNTINTNLNTNALINTITQGLTETQSTSGVTSVTGSQANDRALNVQLSVAGTDPTLTVTVPTLDTPAIVDTNSLSETLSKLSTTTTVTEEQAQAVANEVAETLLSGTTSSTSTSSTSSTSTFFNLYQLMALMVEVAQQQRDSSRELKKAATEQALTSIQAQADKQRDAALAGAIVGGIMSAVQMTSAAVSLVQQSAAFKQQVAAYKESGLVQARSTLSDMESRLDLDTAKTNFSAKLRQMETALGPELNEHIKTQIYDTASDLTTVAAGQEKVAEYNQKIADVKTQLETAKANGNTELAASLETDVKQMEAARDVLAASADIRIAADKQLTSDELTKLRNDVHEINERLESSADFRETRQTIETTRMRHEVFSALAQMGQNLGQGISGVLSAQATEEQATQKKAESQAEQMKEIFDQGQNVIDAAVQLLQAVLQAEVQSMRDAIQA